MELGVSLDSASQIKIEKIEMTQKKQRFEIAVDKAPADVVLDPNTWVLMQAHFVKQ